MNVLKICNLIIAFFCNHLPSFFAFTVLHKEIRTKVVTHYMPAVPFQVRSCGTISLIPQWWQCTHFLPRDFRKSPSQPLPPRPSNILLDSCLQHCGKTDSLNTGNQKYFSEYQCVPVYIWFILLLQAELCVIIDKRLGETNILYIVLLSVCISRLVHMVSCLICQSGSVVVYAGSTHIPWDFIGVLIVYDNVIRVMLIRFNILCLKQMMVMSTSLYSLLSW